MLNFYQEVLMDHYRNPRNNGSLEGHDFCAQQRNSSCGDEVECMGIVHEGKLVRVAFRGKGCVISQATASLLSEKVTHMALEDILIFDKDDLIAMLAMPLGPVRVLCALLSLRALQEGIREYKNKVIY